MSRKQQWGLLLGVVFAVVSGLYAAALVAGVDTSPVNVGTRAPHFSGVTLGSPSYTRSLSDYKGQVVLLNVWRTDCLPCEKEMPSLQKLYEEFKDRGLMVVAVSIEPAGSDGRIRAFAQKYDLTFDILHDPTGHLDKAYRTTGVPESFVIDRNGVITRKVFGEKDWSTMDNRALIAQLVGDETPILQTASPLATSDSGGEGG
jgi:peroxiredoxin